MNSVMKRHISGAMLALIAGLITPEYALAQATGDAFSSWGTTTGDFFSSTGSQYSRKGRKRRPILQGATNGTIGPQDTIVTGEYSNEDLVGYGGDLFSPPVSYEDLNPEQFSEKGNDAFSSGVPSRKKLDAGCTWDSVRMPLRVYFSGGIEYARGGELRQTLKSALNAWCNAALGPVRYVITHDYKVADIVICEEFTTDHEWAESASEFHKGHLDHVKIRFIDSALNPLKLPNAKLKAICLHEIGHALGVTGHSSNPKDVMSTASCDDAHPITALTAADQSMLWRIYANRPILMRYLSARN